MWKNKILQLASIRGFYEQGRNELSLETLIKLAENYQVSTEYLLGITNNRETPVYHSITDAVSLTSKELETILHMHELSLLDEISENPTANEEKLQRYGSSFKKTSS